MQTHPNPTVSVVLPAHREALGIAAAVEAVSKALNGHARDYEIVIVDDGSPDDTYQRVQEVAAGNRHIRGIRLSRNFGKEAALLAGLQAATGEVVITMDADLQHPPELIPEMIKAWRAGAVIVNGVKRDRSSESLIVRGRAAVVNAIISRLSGIDLRNSSDFKLLDRRAVDIIATWLPERMRFYRGLTQWIGFQQVDILFDIQSRTVGTTSFSLRALLRLAMTAMMSFTSAPLRVVTVLGMIIMLLGSVIGVEALWSWIGNRAVSGFTTLIMTLLLIGSVTMISLGIVGEYIARIYDEIKARPTFLVSATCGPRPVENRRSTDPQAQDLWTPSGETAVRPKLESPAPVESSTQTKRPSAIGTEH